MKTPLDQAIAIVGVGAIMPDALDANAFWQNILNKRYSISETPSERWSIADYYDPDPKAPDKTYSKIGGWVRGFEFDWKRFRMPPKVAAAMDEGQQWALTVAADTLADYGYPERPLNTDRTAVILGTAMGGELHYITTQRVAFPEYAQALKATPEFAQLPAAAQESLLSHWHANVDRQIPPITEDTMPGELPNVVSGRIANVLNLRGPNYITDAACASSFAAVEAAVQLLVEGKVDAVLTGGVDRNMGASIFVKFCKIGALSATGTRPFGDGADGFVMGEGVACFLLKRLADAEQAGDKIYAVIRGVAGASDGKGKGITAPNPIGQQLAMRRAWESAGLDPATASLIEAHGTSTRVGDVVEVESLNEVFGAAPRHSIGLGSVKSNIGHLKAGAGAAGLFKTIMALHHKVLPPTLNADRQNPNIPFEQTPFYLVHEARDWQLSNGTPRRAGVSAYGFGGTNFHLVLEEHIPGRLQQERQQITVEANAAPQTPAVTTRPFRGIFSLGATSPADLKEKLDAALARVENGWTPPLALPPTADLQAKERLFIDFGDHAELLDRLQKARKVMGLATLADTPQAWQAMQAQGIFRGSGPVEGKIAFMFPGQGSQYVNMGRALTAVSPIVTEVFNEADRVMTPILGKPLTDYLFVDPNDSEKMGQAQFDLMQTAITQPAMLTLDMAILRLLQSYGFEPDVVMGHSLGEYAALIAAGIMPFADALEAAAARGGEMSKVQVDDNGMMAAVLAPYDVVEATLAEIDGYVVPANINSHSQCVFGGSSEAVQQAVKRFEEKGYQGMLLPVSHAFHTSIVAPASRPLRQVLDRLRITSPQLPLVANVTGDFYPTEVEAIKDILQQQIASPVQWVKGLETLYEYGVRTFVEVGPKRALRGFAKDVFAQKEDVLALMTNHPKTGELPAFNQALCGLFAAGYGVSESAAQPVVVNENDRGRRTEDRVEPVRLPSPVFRPDSEESEHVMKPTTMNDGQTAVSVDELSQVLAQALQRLGSPSQQTVAYDRNQPPAGSVIVSGTGLGLPGADKPVMDPDNALRILQGEQFVDLIPERFRQRIVNKRITRLVKSANGDGSFETITDPGDVIKLAGRGGSFDLTEEYGVPAKLVEALDITTQLAMAAGLDALREAGIPLVQTYRRTTTDKFLPDRWGLPPALQDETGVIFASAFPGGDRFAADFEKYYAYQSQLDQLHMLEELRQTVKDRESLLAISQRANQVRAELTQSPYIFDRRFLFRILAMGHSQFAEYIGARGPNTHVNAACASTTQAMALAEDWIRSGRCRRVIVIAADDATSDHLMEWVGAGFLAVGAAATDDQVAEAAIPFDRRRHGTILGMGACAMVLESEDAIRERGMRGIVELLSSESRNSAYHGSRLDVAHIGSVMDDLVTAAERRFGVNRQAMASELVFMSHETFTPARGGSASAEVMALRHTFGASANDIVVANTKGFTGHPMGVGIEDVIAIKILEHGIVPPVPNHKETDPDLGPLNLSRGGRYPVQYALHLAAGFGSQIAFSLTRRIPGGLDRIDNKGRYQQWLNSISGYDRAATEVVHRNLRVVSNGVPQRDPSPSTWQYGTGPVVRASEYSMVSNHYAVKPVARVEQTPQQPPVVERPLPTITPPLPPSPPKETPSPVPQPVQPAVATAEVSPLAADNDSPTTADPIADKVLAIVAAQTGYPTDMLDLDLDLEADLGVDTVKQAETFLAIRQAFDIPSQDNLQLRDYPTLEHVIGFVREMRPDLSSEQVTVDSGQLAVESEKLEVGSEPLATENWLLTTENWPRRVPVPALRPALDVCLPTGVTLDETSRVVVAPDEGGVGRALVNRLEKMGVTVLELDANATADSLTDQLKSWLADGPIQGIYWLPALDVEPDLTDLTLADWRVLNQVRVKNLALVMRTLYEQISGPDNFLVAVTRLGGLHGYGAEGATAPLGGAVTGFAKAFKRERSEALVKAVDFAPGRRTAVLAAALIAETLHDPGVVEVGYRDEQRFTVTLAEQPAADGQPGLTLNSDTVFLVTGAAGGITSAIVADLAQASGGIFYLLDLVEAPPAADPHVALFRRDKEALKQQFIQEAKAVGEKVTPVAIDKKLMAVERAEAALRAVEAVEAAGGTAVYRSVNLLDGPALVAVVDEIRERYGRIDVLLHAGGLEISRPLDKKDTAEFDLVFDVKADGLFSLLHAAGEMPIAAVVSFSSVAGRFGNTGQTDYSAANDLLCKLTSSLRRWRPQTRGIVLDWTAWGGIGMATRGSIPKIMEMAGIEMLPPEVGVPIVRRELTAGGFSGEIVVAGKLGMMAEEWHETGGLDLAALNANGPLLGEVLAYQLYGGLAVKTTLDPQRQPFLYDHAMDGTPLLPGVMGTEIFAQLAAVLAPDYHVTAVEDETFHAAFKFYRMEPQTLYLKATAVPDGDDLLAHTSLRSRRELKTGEVQEKRHFTATVRLSREKPTPPAVTFDPPAELPIDQEAVYRVYFHGPAYKVLAGVQVNGQGAVGLMADGLPANMDPADAPELVAPRLIELCFQTAGIWEAKMKGVLALPHTIGAVTAYAQETAAVANGRLYATVEAVNGGESFNAQVVDEAGNVYVELVDYRTVQLPVSVTL